MTFWFQQFVTEMTERLDSFDAPEVAEYIDRFWFEHEKDLDYNSGPIPTRTEDSIVSDFWELADRFDASDAIVQSDPYCISASDFKNECSELLNRYNLLAER